jgi:hypothetical protein
MTLEVGSVITSRYFRGISIIYRVLDEGATVWLINSEPTPQGIETYESIWSLWVTVEAEIKVIKP